MSRPDRVGRMPDIPTDRADLAAVLDRVAATAEDGAIEQAQLATAARAAAREERSTSSPAQSPSLRRVLESVAGHAERFTAAAGELRRTWAGALAVQGFSRRQIAAHLGVSHQRVSALLGRTPADPPPGTLPVGGSGGAGV